MTIDLALFSTLAKLQTLFNYKIIRKKSHVCHQYQNQLNQNA